MKNHKKMVAFYKAICDRRREHILELLRKHKQLNVTEIVSRSDISQPTVSHHLHILLNAEVITSKKKGKEVYYSSNPKVINDCCLRTMKCFGR